MTRFFIPSHQISGNTVTLYGSDQHHLLNVLRKKVGDEITVLNGKGEEFLVRITEAGPDLVTGEIIEEINRPVEPLVAINLAQSLLKADKFELILQKNTEIGVSSFQPVITERSTIKLDRETAARKWERWRKIIKEAAEQSGRKIIPQLEQVRSWEEVVSNFQSELVLLPWEGETKISLKKVLESQPAVPGNVTVLIGPEGGFSLEEVNRAREGGAVPVTLGPRILRTETAGLVVSSVLLYHFDCLG